LTKIIKSGISSKDLKALREKISKSLRIDAEHVFQIQEGLKMAKSETK
jgi:hypothetical protein